MSAQFPAKMTAIRAVFSAMFDAVETMGEFDESKWIDLIAAFNATGRLVFGWPHLESSESDIFGALDDIAMQLEGTKNAIEITSKDARIVLHELHEALGPLLEPDEPEPTLDPPLLPEPDPAPLVDVKQTGISESERQVIEVPSSVDEGASRVGRGADEPVASRPGPPYASDPQTPNEQDERLFAAVRGDPAISMAAAEREAGMAQSRGIQRLKLLDGYGTLPDDIKQWREDRSKTRGVPKGVSSLYMHQEARRPAPTSIPEALSGESFEERRQRLARERAAQTWRELHPDATA